MNVERERKVQRMTPIQLQMMVDIISVNPELISGKLTPHFTREDRRNKWEALATLLNSKGLGPEKDADKWRKSWSDLKFAIRSKAAKIEIAGKSDLNDSLTNLEKRVLLMIGDVATIDNSEGGVDLSAKPLTSGSGSGQNETLSDAQKRILKLIGGVSSTDSLEGMGIRPNNLKEKLPKDVRIEHKLAHEPAMRKSLANPKKLILPTFTVNDDPEVPEGVDHNKDELELEELDASSVLMTDDEDEVDEPPASNADESLTPPRKKRRVSSENTDDSIPALIAVQRQIELQTEVLHNQTNILRDIAKSLQSIAKSLQDR